MGGRLAEQPTWRGWAFHLSLVLGKTWWKTECEWSEQVVLVSYLLQRYTVISTKNAHLVEKPALLLCVSTLHIIVSTCTKYWKLQLDGKWHEESNHYRWWTKHWPPAHGLPQWTTLKWTTRKNNPNEYYLMSLAASIIKLHITSAFVHPNLWRAFGESLFDNYEKVASSKKHTHYLRPEC